MRICNLKMMSGIPWRIGPQYDSNLRPNPRQLICSCVQGYDFGWEPDTDGFRGHVFTTPDNSTIVLSIKGTSAGLPGRGGPTVKKDKLNDNLLFSCCCAKVDWSWTPVCDCHRGGWRCSQDCLETSLTTESLFYQIGTVRSTPALL